METRGSLGKTFDVSKKPLSKDHRRTSMKNDIPVDPEFDELVFFLKQQEKEQKDINEANIITKKAQNGKKL